MLAKIGSTYSAILSDGFAEVGAVVSAKGTTPNNMHLSDLSSEGPAGGG
jgi:hypothetical protein